MTLEEIVLEKLNEWQPQDSERQTLAVADPKSGWSVSFSVDRNDDLSCALWEMSQRSPSALSESGLTVTAWAEKVAGQARGLLEPLQVIEIDSQRDEALLRSQEPAVRKADRYYYEVLLKGSGQADVRRYRGSVDVSRRQQVPFTLTHESVARLAADLVF
jgi:hypothetical protein